MELTLVKYSLTEEIQEFAVNFMHSLQSCLEETPELLKNQKLKGYLRFRRKTRLVY